MKEKVCCFCGHRYVTDKIEHNIEEILINLIENQGYNTFFSGGMGEFDKICENTIRKLKLKYKHIKLCKILYFYSTKKIDEFLYDEYILPDLSNIYYKKLISERNKWMVKKTQTILCYVHKKYGGAYAMLKYSQKENINIINICD